VNGGEFLVVGAVDVGQCREVRPDALAGTIVADRRDLEDGQVVGTVALLRLGAVDHRVVEARDMPRCLPDLRMLDDGRIEADDAERLVVGPEGRPSDHVIPPGVAEVVLELDAERAVVPEPVDPAVDLAGGKMKPRRLQRATSSSMDLASVWGAVMTFGPLVVAIDRAQSRWCVRTAKQGVDGTAWRDPPQQRRVWRLIRRWQARD
jgi:hypothetical protein